MYIHKGGNSTSTGGVNDEENEKVTLYIYIYIQRWHTKVIIRSNYHNIWICNLQTDNRFLNHFSGVEQTIPLACIEMPWRDRYTSKRSIEGSFSASCGKSWKYIAFVFSTYKWKHQNWCWMATQNWQQKLVICQLMATTTNIILMLKY